MAATTSSTTYISTHQARQLRTFGVSSLVTLFAIMLVMVYLLPFVNMMTISLRDYDDLSQSNPPLLPMVPIKFTYEGEAYEVFNVPINGEMKELALVKPGRQSTQFVDPANPEAGIIEWEGNWRILEPSLKLQPRWSNYQEAWEKLNFPRLFRNTLVIAIGGVIGTLLSCIAVAYAFARFPIPGKNILFVILIGTIILPGQVTLIPTYIFFAKVLHWTGTWLPLIVPHFFANAYNVFLLRQYFLTLPRELDEAAMIDGAGPFTILLRIIIPQSWPAIIAVAIFHFVFAWNDFFGPLIYLLGEPKLQPISVGVQIFNFQYGPRPDLIQATSVMTLLLPVIIFILAQRVFMRGVVVTGVDK